MSIIRYASCNYKCYLITNHITQLYKPLNIHRQPVYYFARLLFEAIQEEYGNVKRKNSDFKKFGDAVLATTVDEITSSGQTDVVNLTYNIIEYNVPIDQSLFEEDMPKNSLSSNE